MSPKWKYQNFEAETERMDRLMVLPWTSGTASLSLFPLKRDFVFVCYARLCFFSRHKVVILQNLSRFPLVQFAFDSDKDVSNFTRCLV